MPAAQALDLLRADLDGAGLLLVGALLFFGLGMVRRSFSQAAVEEDRLEAEDERNRLIELKTRSQTLRWTRLFSVLLLLLLRRGTPAWFSVLELPAKAVFAVLWAVVFLGVYVFPIVVYCTR